MGDNRITDVLVTPRLLNPAEAELWLRIELERPSCRAEVHGRLQGPRCRYATTVEVAYPLRPAPYPPDSDQLRLLRLVIPEPSWWDVESPFYYEGPIELWEAGEPISRLPLRVGLRQVAFSARGLRWNGHPLELRAVRRAQLTEQEADQLRAAGRNSLLTPVSPASANVWELADRVGLVVLGLLDPEPATLQLAADLGGHPSCLGWIVPGSAFRGEMSWLPELQRRCHRRGQLLGAHCLPEGDIHQLRGVQFVLGEQRALADLAATGLPGLVWSARSQANGPLPGMLGWVED